MQKPTKNIEWGLIKECKEWTSLCLSHASKTKVSHVNTTFTNNDTGRVKKKKTAICTFERHSHFTLKVRDTFSFLSTNTYTQKGK